MAEILDRMPTWVRQGRREVYPYDEWFDGQVRWLTRGVDFVQERRGMAARIRSAAKTRSFAVSIGHREMPHGAEVIVVGPRMASLAGRQRMSADVAMAGRA